MNNSENRRAPSLGGWVIAAGAGLVAAAVALVVGNLSYPQAGFIGIAILLLVGLILGMSWGSAAVAAPRSTTVKPMMPAVEPTATLPVMAEPVLAASSIADPVMAASPMAVPAMAEAAPVAFVSAPMPDTAAPAKPARMAKPKAAAKPVVAKAAAKPAAPKVAKVKKPDGPTRLSAPRKGMADDLKEIEGIGPALEKLCNSLGFYHFDQIAGWSDADIAWVDANMKTFRGRIVRDKWIVQSKIILSEGLEAFRVRAQTNNY